MTPHHTSPFLGYRSGRPWLVHHNQTVRASVPARTRRSTLGWSAITGLRIHIRQPLFHSYRSTLVCRTITGCVTISHAGPLHPRTSRPWCVAITGHSVNGNHAGLSCWSTLVEYHNQRCHMCSPHSTCADIPQRCDTPDSGC